MTTNTLPTAPLRVTRTSASFARHLPTAARFLLGAVFFVFGLNGFLNFIPPPTAPMPEAVMAFSGALMKTGYMFPLIKGTEVVAGALLLSNCFVPLALVLLAPVVVNIFAFHAFLAPADIGMAALVVLLEAYLAWVNRGVYRPLFALRPAVASK
jgi:uncharacterized membrane protein YphA (DoxX/SURF4 family)